MGLRLEGGDHRSDSRSDDLVSAGAGEMTEKKKDLDLPGKCGGGGECRSYGGRNVVDGCCGQASTYEVGTGLLVRYSSRDARVGSS